MHIMSISVSAGDEFLYAGGSLGGNLISEPQSPPNPAPPAMEFPLSDAGHAEPTVAFPRRSRAPRVVIVLLAVTLAAVVATLVFYLVQLGQANDLITDQKRQLEEQSDLLDKKETFGAAMGELLTTAQSFDGVLMASIVPTDEYERFARQAWVHRWDSSAVDRDIEHVIEATAELNDLLAAASTQTSTNVTGTVYETVTDQLGGGFVTSTLEDADTLCGADVLGCVSSEDPYIVHFDAADHALPYLNDVLATGIAYHEFAHVLQFTNPQLTRTALDAFGGDAETMADCYALTYLPGWKLHHRVWVSSYQYYEVDIGYGYTCNDSQRQVVRDWYEQLGYTTGPISQS